MSRTRVSTRRDALRALSALAVTTLAPAVRAHDGPHPKPVSTGPDFATLQKKSRDWFTDTELVDQDGRPVRFYSDVLQGHTVLINVIFTECRDACPLMTRNLVEVKRALGDAQNAVRFVSISIDPERDTPAALREFARKNEADLASSWVFLTGRKPNVELVTRKLGQHALEREAHTSLLIAGNVDRAHWVKIRPDTRPEAVAMRLRTLAKP